MKLPKISVIIPVALHEECNKSVESLKKVDYPSEKIEIITIKGNRPCEQRNKGAYSAKGDILYFLDNDSIINPDIFKKAITYYSDERVVGVGGPSLTFPSDNILQKSFGLLLSSFFSSLSMASRFRSIGKTRKATEKELILCNMSIRRGVFVKEKGFNEVLYPNEENEFVNRLVRKNYSFIYDPDIIIYKSQRGSVVNFSKQLWKEGWGRTRHFLIHPSFFEPLFLLPAFFLFYLISLIFVHNALYLIPLALYLIWITIGSFDMVFRGKSLIYFLLGIPLFFIFHLSYAVGTITGFSKRFDPKAKYKVPVIRLEKIKSFLEKWR